ncbi:MAG: hypothetical protein H0V17_06080 [Deltaproteobacteria bacterium]|nr:hypothetical protein [Deltaproteobacteria bacterium]
MSRFTNLVVVLSLAACETAAPTQSAPVFPEPASKIEATKAPEPPAAIAEVAPAPAPAVAPVKPKAVPKKTVAPEPAPVAIDGRIGEGKGAYYPPGCRPGSRMMCRWREDVDERVVPRVTKKPSPETATESP